MANQFDAKIRFDPCAWRAVIGFQKGDEIDALLEVSDSIKYVSTWRVRIWMRGELKLDERGEMKNPQACRAKCRRVYDKFMMDAYDR